MRGNFASFFCVSCWLYGLTFVWHDLGSNCSADRTSKQRLPCMHIYLSSRLGEYTLLVIYGIRTNLWLPLSLLVATSVIWGQFGLRSGQRECRSWSGSKQFDTLKASVPCPLKRLSLKKVSRHWQKHKKLPSMLIAKKKYASFHLIIFI